MHWLADVSIPIDISWTNASGEEMSGDDVTSDEDSVWDDDENDAGAATPVASSAVGTAPVAHGTPGLMAELSQQQLLHAPVAARDKGGESSIRNPPPKPLQNPGSRVWRSEIEVRRRRSG